LSGAKGAAPARGKKQARLAERRSPGWSLPAGAVPRFAATFLALQTLTVFFPETAFAPLNHHTAWMAARLLTLCGLPPVLQGNLLGRGSFTVEVVTECSALYMGILFLSFVVAGTATPLRKIAGLALGIPFLHAVNIVRIAWVFALGASDRALFESAHVYFGQVAMVSCVVAVSVAWFRMAVSGSPPGVMPSFLVRLAAFSAISFLLWLPLNTEYVRLIDHAVRWLFRLWGYRLEMVSRHAVYYQTFNLVTLAGLVLAGLPFLKRRMLRVLAPGLLLIVGLHIAGRVCNVMMFAFRNAAAARVFAETILVGQYLVPVLIWLLLLRGEPGGKRRALAVSPDHGNFTCG